MGYRLPDDREQFSDVAKQSVINLDNGTISRISIPCFYKYGQSYPKHDRMMHDHVGWPSPRHVDDSCQLPPMKYDQILVLNEIDLPSEGYTSIEVAMVDEPDGLTVSGVINHNVINLTITIMCQDAIEENIDVPFAVYAIGSTAGRTDVESVDLRDVVTKGVLHIIAGPIIG